ncbi:secreted Ly-6/uPAR-related protein 1 [Octodon degus]|uniref:Secreted Ly-6/uPAR-related protein 1 n=1 Tax=Octodon degus TaxID=10160 RepID=A0A6P3FG40_OCTDE|nr:secreted Ly-6/uPAR-related protein 1 [Octodon degus]
MEPAAPKSCASGMTSRWVMQLLLLAAWSVGSGESFRCYSCDRPTPVHLCKNISYCTLEDTACKTTLEKVEAEYPFNQSPMVTRSCSTSCLATDPDSIGVAHPVFCCFRDLCNTGEVSGI